MTHDKDDPKHPVHAKPVKAEPEPEVKPAKVHHDAHSKIPAHEAGADPVVLKAESDKAKDAADKVAKDAEKKGEPVVVPAPLNNAAILYGLRVAGRLYRCRLPGRDSLLIEADSPELAKQGYCDEQCRLDGNDPKKPEKGDKAEKKSQGITAEMMSSLPAGTTITVGDVQPPAELKAEAVKCVKLSA